MIAVAIFVYHAFVERRNSMLVQTTARSNKIVTSLFPSNVRDKLYGEEEKSKQKQQLVSFMNGGQDLGSTECSNDIIADHFDQSSILFADMVGFTSWSSSREPHQVFLLLETIYHSFDATAKRRGVYKGKHRQYGGCYAILSWPLTNVMPPHHNYLAFKVETVSHPTLFRVPGK